MINVTTILLAMDGSDGSWKALDYALTMARQHGARLVAVHVVNRIEIEGIRRALQLANLSESDDRLTSLQKEYETNACSVLSEIVGVAQRAGVPIETTAVIGSPAEDIVRLAREIKADLIVIGTHGRHGLSRVFLGSVAERVVRTAPCPVLTVRGLAVGVTDGAEEALAIAIGQK